MHSEPSSIELQMLIQNAVQEELASQRRTFQRWLRLAIIVAIVAFPFGVSALGPFTAYQAGDQISAGDMNTRFDAIASAVTALEAVDASNRLDALEAALPTLAMDTTVADHQTELISMAGQGGFTGGTIRVTRVGTLVTISTVDQLQFAAVSSIAAPAVIPVWARPKDVQINVNIVTTGGDIGRIDIDSSGRLRLIYYDSDFAFKTRSNGGGESITYNLE